MKRIRIVNYQKPDLSSVYLASRQYSISFGNGKRLIFNSEKKINKFIAETNKMLNSVWHELNYLYGQIFVEYRNIWFVLDNEGLKRIEIDFKNQTQLLDRAFNWISTHSNYSPNYNAFMYQYLYKCIGALLNMAFSVSKVLETRDEYHSVQKLHMFKRQIETIKKKIDNWGCEYLV